MPSRQLRVSSTLSTLRPVLVVVAPINSTTARRSVSGRPRQFCVMWQNSRCSILFHFEVPVLADTRSERLEGVDGKGLLELIEEMRARVSRQTGRAVEVISCYEAGYDGFWLHRQLEAQRSWALSPPRGGESKTAARLAAERARAVIF
jgi:hypothetical protein